MVNGRVSVQIRMSEVKERLNHLEYAVSDTVRLVTHLRRSPLREQTMDFLELMKIVKDAIGVYRDEVADQIDLE